MRRFLEKRKCSCMSVSQTTSSKLIIFLSFLKRRGNFLTIKHVFFQGCLNVLNRFPAQQISQFAPFSLVVTILVLCVIFCYFAPFSRVTVLLLRAISTQQLFYFWRPFSARGICVPSDWPFAFFAFLRLVSCETSFCTTRRLFFISTCRTCSPLLNSWLSLVVSHSWAATVS